MEVTIRSGMRRRTSMLALLLALLSSLMPWQSVQADPLLVSSVLPSSRSVALGSTATLFATIINAGDTRATGCSIEIPQLPASETSFQTTNPATNQPTGTPNTPVDIAPGAAQSFLLAILPTAELSELRVQPQFRCTNANPAVTVDGVNTFVLSASANPTPDVVALSATPSADGVVGLRGLRAANVFTVATINLGASGMIEAAVELSRTDLPASASICQTDPVTSACINPVAPSAGPVTAMMGQGEAATFGVFITGSGDVAFDPANHRAFLRFRDTSNTVRGSTSVAFSTDAPGNVALSRAALPKYAELVRRWIVDSAATLDEITAYGADRLPVFAASNGLRNANCGFGGTESINTTGEGRAIVRSFSDCAKSNTLLNGLLADYYSDIDTAAGSFRFSREYGDYSSNRDGISELRSGSWSLLTVVEGQNFRHLLTTDSTFKVAQSGVELTARGVRLEWVRPFLSQSESTLVAAAGSLIYEGLGTVHLSFDDRLRLRDSAGNSSSFSFVDGTLTLEWLEQGVATAGIMMANNQSYGLSVFDGVNSPPRLITAPAYELAVSVPATLAFGESVFDADLDVLNFDLAIDANSPGMDMSLAAEGAGQFQATANQPGTYALRLSANQAEGPPLLYTFDVAAFPDTDGDGTTDNRDTDDDGDGVADSDDAFPLDASEQADADADGIGDNADTDDDNDGVADVNDAFPLNAGCADASEGRNGVCLVELMTQFDKLLIDNSGVLHVVQLSEKQLYRWNLVDGSFPAPISLGGIMPSNALPRAADYSTTHELLYIGYDNGGVSAVDSSGVETLFTTVAESVGSLAAAGDWLMVQDPSGAWVTHSYFDSAGTLTDSKDWNYFSRNYAWSNTLGRLYFFRDDTSPNDLHYEAIDAAGAIVGEGETPYHGDYSMVGPIVIQPGGGLVLIGSGNLFNLNDLTWAGAIPGGIVAARWEGTDLIVVRAGAENQSILERRNAELTIVEQVVVDGEPLGLFATSAGLKLLVRRTNHLAVVDYVPSDDSDGDGVGNLSDDFPLDVSASLDSDNDGYPDAWNSGYSEADSTTGLVLDVYPQDSACYLAEHGNAGVCDISSTLPDYEPTQIADEAQIAYMLSPENNRVYRYSLDAGHLSPIVVGDTGALGGTSPHILEHAVTQNRLYLGYDSGRITFVDLADSSLGEQEFATIPSFVHGLGDMGDYVMAADSSGAWNSHYVFAADGTLTDSREWNRRSGDYAWNATRQRIYFFRDGTSPNDLHFEEIDAAGMIIDDGETPGHGDYRMGKPIVMSPDDSLVVIGSSHVFNTIDLTWSSSLLNQFTAAVWDHEGELITARSDDAGGTVIDLYTQPSSWAGETAIAGEPLAIITVAAGRYMVVTQLNGKPTFTEYLID